MTRRKNAHCCENCAYFYSNGSRCECEQEAELTEKQYIKHFENCEAGCPLFSKKPEYSRAEKNFLARHIEELKNREKITGYNKIFWLNDSTGEIYAHSIDAELSGVINGWKVCNVNELN